LGPSSGTCSNRVRYSAAPVTGVALVPPVLPASARDPPGVAAPPPLPALLLHPSPPCRCWCCCMWQAPPPAASSPAQSAAATPCHPGSPGGLQGGPAEVTQAGSDNRGMAADAMAPGDQQLALEEEGPAKPGLLEPLTLGGPGTGNSAPCCCCCCWGACHSCSTALEGSTCEDAAPAAPPLGVVAANAALGKHNTCCSSSFCQAVAWT
jgi:hypothetical protein